MQFQVPQFVEVEDKIVGPLTLRQFLYVAGAVGISLMLFFVVKLWLWFVFSIFIIAGAVALAIVKINGQPLIRVATSALWFYWRPQTYVWQREKKKTEKEAPMAEKEEKLSLENVISGLALKKSWQNLQTGSRATELFHWGSKNTQNKYEVIRKITGDKQVARRVDYR